MKTSKTPTEAPKLKFPQHVEAPVIKQGDLLFGNLTGSSIQYLKQKPTVGRGWLLVNEVSIHGEIINANFCPEGGNGYGNVIWPTFECEALIRGRHGECSPFAALTEIFKSRTVAVALTS